MNKIVVGIDFSDCSVNALIHALSIADHCNGELILVWVQKSANEKEKFVDKTSDVTTDVKAAFEDMIAKYGPDHPNVKISWKIRTGKIYREITDEAKHVDAMLVVVGTHGASGFESFWIGSNANKIVSASICPVITIRSGINIKRPLTRIVMPIDSSDETRQKVKFTTQLAKLHKAEIFILKLYTSRLKDIRHKVDLYAIQVVNYLAEQNVKYQIDFAECENISSTTIDYAKKIEANLISVMTSQEGSSNIFLGPYAHQIVNQSPIPVLSIHPSQALAVGQAF